MSTVAMMTATGAAAGDGRTKINLIISTDTIKYNIWDNKGATYTAGTTDVKLTINSGIYLYSNTTNTGDLGDAALKTGSGWTTGDTITITGAGNITGCAGNGAAATTAAGSAGNPGTAGIFLNWNITFSGFTGVVAGGGGGGGASAGGYNYISGSSESGRPGGKGGDFTNLGTGVDGGPGGSPGGIGGSPGVAGGASSSNANYQAGGGGGGGYGANGGSAGQGGTSGYPIAGPVNGGGGGQAGRAINLNGYTVTGTPGTVYGNIS